MRQARWRRTLPATLWVFTMSYLPLSQMLGGRPSQRRANKTPRLRVWPLHLPLILAVFLFAAAAAAPAKPNPRSAAAQKAAAARAAAARRTAKKPAPTPRANSRTAPNRATLGSRGMPAPAGVSPAAAADVRSLRRWPSPPGLVLRVHAPYRAADDLRPDLVLVESAPGGRESQAESVRSWRGAGYEVHASLPFGSGAGGDASEAPSGAPVQAGEPGSDAWLSNLLSQASELRSAGATGFWISSPSVAVRSTPGALFQAAWRQSTGESWTGDATEVETASRLRADLIAAACGRLIEGLRAQAAPSGVRVVLELETPLQLLQRERIGDPAALSALDVDAISGSAAPSPGTDGLIQADEAAWMEASYLRSLSVQGGPALLLGGAGGDAWKERLVGIARAGSASGYVLDASAPAGLMESAGILRGLAAADSLAAAPLPELAAPLYSSLAWQDGGDIKSALAGVLGLVSPLLTGGAPLALVAGERLEEPLFAQQFRGILLETDHQAPRSPSAFRSLAGWVRAGGVLVANSALGSETPSVWWKRAGYSSPLDHLLTAAPVPMDWSAVEYRVGGKFEPAGEIEEMDGDRALYRLVMPEGAPAESPLLIRFAARDRNSDSASELMRVRVIEEGERLVRADFRPGSAAEQPFLVEDGDSQATQTGRQVSKPASFVYRFARLRPGAIIEASARGRFDIGRARGSDPRLQMTPAHPALQPITLSTQFGLRLLPPVRGAARPLYQTAGETAAVWLADVGAGKLLFSGFPSAWFLETPAAGRTLRSLLELTGLRAGGARSDGSAAGPYRLFIQPMPVKGKRFVHLFSPSLDFAPLAAAATPQLVIEPQARYDQPSILHSSARVEGFFTSGLTTTLTLSGPAGAAGRARIATAGLQLTGVEPRTPDLNVRNEGTSILVEAALTPAGRTIVLQWRKAEARLTK